jgi:hypothetical protein
MAQIKLKVFKLERDKKASIVQQIEWLKTHLNDDFDCDFMKSIFPLKKPELIKIWVDLVVRAEYPELDWIMIYY